MCVNYSYPKNLRNKREIKIQESKLTEDADSSPPAPTWRGNLKGAARILEALHKHPFASSLTFLANRSWSNSLTGSLHFHKYFSNPLRCFGGTVIASPLPLSLHQVLRKTNPLRASSLSFFDAWRYPSNVASRVMKPFTVKRSLHTLLLHSWLINSTLSYSAAPG